MDTNNILGQIIALLIIPLLPAVSTFIIAWFKAKTEEINSNIKNQTAKNYIDILNCTIADVVTSLNQTMVENLKNAASDGKLTKEDGEKIKRDALEQVYKILGIKGIEVLKEIYTDLDSLIVHKLEANVNTLKLEKEKKLRSS